MIAALATVLQRPGMEDVDDEEYTDHAGELADAAQALQKAGSQKDMAILQTAIVRLSATCAACHEDFR